MPGAVYRNSSSPSGGRKDRGERRDEPLSFRPEHPANVRTSASKKLEKEPDSPLSAPLSASQGKGARPARSQAGKNDGRTSSPRSWEVRLTPSMLIMLGILTLVTLCFFFLFGLIIGRGSVPPPPQPELEHLLPQTSATTPEAPEHILPEEELRFMTNLKSDVTATVGDTSGEQAAPPPATASQANPSREADNPKPATPTRQDTGKYDFVLRVAAFKAEEQADALRATLEGAGMRTRMVKQKAQKGTWHFVQVLYRGTTDNMQALRDRLGEFGLKDSIVSSKTPVR